MKTPLTFLIKSLLILAVILSITPAIAQNHAWSSGNTWFGAPNAVHEHTTDTSTITLNSTGTQVLNCDSGTTGSSPGTRAMVLDGLTVSVVAKTSRAKLRVC